MLVGACQFKRSTLPSSVSITSAVKNLGLLSAAACACKGISQQVTSNKATKMAAKPESHCSDRRREVACIDRWAWCACRGVDALSTEERV